MKTEIKPVWNVYDYSHNDNEMRVFNVFNHSSTAACAAARRAIGTRNGEHET